MTVKPRRISKGRGRLRNMILYRHLKGVSTKSSRVSIIMDEFTQLTDSMIKSLINMCKRHETTKKTTN